MNIKNLPLHERPREKLMSQGSENLKDPELLAILFRTGRAGKSAIDMAENVLKKYPMKQWKDLSFPVLTSLKGIDQSKACSLLAAIELGKRAHQSYHSSLPLIQTPADALIHFNEIRNYKREYFLVLYLNARNQLLKKEIISIGTANMSVVHPREVFAPALELRSTSIILAHNHPSESTQPSSEDIQVTEQLYEAGMLLGIEVLDHLIVTKTDYTSMKELLLL